MLRKKRTKTFRSSFRGFFSHQAMDALVKKLYVVIPSIPSMAQRLNTRFTIFTEGFLKRIFGYHPRLSRKISMVNLDSLQKTLAMHLKRRTDNLIQLTTDDVKFEKFNLNAILKSQSEMLRELIEEQKKALRDESKSLLDEELEEFRKRRQSKTQRRNNRNT